MAVSAPEVSSVVEGDPKGRRIHWDQPGSIVASREQIRDDPYRDDVYAAENDAAPDGGRRFRRFTHVESLIDDIVTSSWWDDTFPQAPIEIVVMRRSRGATFSAATVDGPTDTAAVWIRDGSWDMVTVLHELAHVAASPGDPTGPHGEWFATALAELWRRFMGFHAYGALQSALAARAVPLRLDRRP